MTQKQIKDRFLKELPAPYGQLAADNTTLKNRYDWGCLDDNSTIAELLLKTFLWEKTPEGNIFWSQIHESLASGIDLKTILGKFEWNCYDVRVWKSEIRIGCQRIPRKYVKRARNKKEFRINGYEVSFDEDGMNYGASIKVPNSKLDILFGQLTKLKF